MNFDPVARVPGEIQSLVNRDIGKIQNERIAQGLRSFLIEPRLETRLWDWSRPVREYPVWVVAESPKYDYGIAFSDYGFAPEYPWGLILLSGGGFDADYCWYSSLYRTSLSGVTSNSRIRGRQPSFGSTPIY